MAEMKAHEKQIYANWTNDTEVRKTSEPVKHNSHATRIVMEYYESSTVL